MKNFSILFFLFITVVMPCWTEITAKEVAQKAATQETAAASISYIKTTLKTITAPAEKRSLYAFLGALQEQLSLYKDATASYVAAAGISASDAPGMPKKTSHQLVLDAVRCALCSGDVSTADSYLNSAVRSSKDQNVQATIKLYEIWSTLCKIDSPNKLDEPVALLKAYSTMDSMKYVQPSVLLTLWYVTGEQSYGEEIKKKFPKSPEASVVTGTVQMLPSPFWYFMPKKGDALAAAVEENVESAKIDISSQSATQSNNLSDEDKEKSDAPKKYQLGLFKNKDNALSLCDSLKQKGFVGYITEEKRASGTTYYIVLVDENSKSNIGVQLRSAGFECYPVF